MSDADSESSDQEIRKIKRRSSSESSYEDGAAQEDIETLVQGPGGTRIRTKSGIGIRIDIRKVKELFCLA
ncbi:hypothetical protein EVAR_9169_1 [Eumeta japonica]|uniref:Uncharacterized protein n=1 Tax=Eumeta variegata TaxID=151549 RepID=A0A4C1TWB8_EUMVA|nr:hypothetical protein EVAR_9169_1 [Eumeta japonica]